jgi:2-polyprenyl-6-hydroxyphenyl methylase/3-demethylubiquinone-9 3-methyltransferase
MVNKDQVNQRYYGHSGSGASHEATRARIHWMCGHARRGKVLDIGCSQGIASILLGREGYEVLGVDLEDEAIRYARAELAKEPAIVRSNVRFMTADATKPHDWGPFDTVLLGEVLEHFAQPERILANAAGWLADGGVCVITVPFGLHAFHDHKQTFYAGRLAELTDPYFDEITMEVHHRYLCYAGRKRSFRLRRPDHPERLKRLIRLDEEHFLAYEKQYQQGAGKLKTMIQNQNTRIQALEAQLKQKNDRIEGLTRQLKGLQRQLAEARKRSEPGKGGKP